MSRRLEKKEKRGEKIRFYSCNSYKTVILTVENDLLKNVKTCVCDFWHSCFWVNRIFKLSSNTSKMSIEAKKLSFIERFMKLNQERSISRLEAVITEIEMNTRAESSEKDIKQGKTRSYDDFNTEVKQWLMNKTIK